VITVEEIAYVLEWAGGASLGQIAAATSDVNVMENAQWCLEDITEATK
jgi:hypothetical protein